MISTAVIVGEISATDWASRGGKPSACFLRPGGEEVPLLPDDSVAAVVVLMRVDPLVGYVTVPTASYARDHRPPIASRPRSI
jgi:hypothetical protein